MMRKKKYLAVLALLLIAAMVSTATLAYAPQIDSVSVETGNGGKEKGKQKNSPKSNGNKGNANGQKGSDQDEQEDLKQGQKQKPNQGGQKKSEQGNQQGKPEKLKGSLDIEEIKASIAAIADASTQGSLTELLTAYETALANEENGRTGGADKQSMKALEEAVAAAQSALATALTNAGIAVDQNKSNGVGKGPQGPKHLDLDTIEASIAKLADENVKASLTALVAAYKTALANEQSGIATGADEAAIAAYRKAVEDAKAAVLKALTGAGINGSETPATPSSLPKGQQKKLLDVDAIAASIAAMTDTQTQASLTALTDAYEAAVAGMESAWATGDDAERETSREAVKAAEDALLKALESAGVEAPATDSQQKLPKEQRVTGIWVAAVNWFSNLFKQLFQ